MGASARAIRDTVRHAGAPSGPRQADRRRSALVDAAGALFIKKGLEATTMDEVASRAAVAKGTLYHYFSSKTELVEALRERFCAEFMTRVEDSVEARAENDWKGRLTSWIVSVVETYLEMSALHDLVFHGADMPLRHAMGGVNINQYLSKLLKDGASAGAWRIQGSTEEVAVIMFYGVCGAADEVIVSGRSATKTSKLLCKLYLQMVEAV